MTIIHETDVPEVEQPGRSMRWLVHPEALHASNLSFCVIRVHILVCAVFLPIYR
jgi:hypothetical protein